MCLLFQVFFSCWLFWRMTSKPLPLRKNWTILNLTARGLWSYGHVWPQADPNVQNYLGATPLHYVLAWKHRNQDELKNFCLESLRIIIIIVLYTFIVFRVLWIEVLEALVKRLESSFFSGIWTISLGQSSAAAMIWGVFEKKQLARDCKSLTGEWIAWLRLWERIV